MEEKKEYKNEGMEEIKSFVKTYWKELALIIGGCIISGTIVSHKVKAKNSDKKSLFTKLQPWAEEIDTDIFTDLAPKIEQAVLNSGIEKAVFEKNYDLDDLTHKLVTVTVEKINGD